VRASIEEIMLVEIGEAINFRLFVLEMNECGDSLGVYLKSADIFLDFILLFPQRSHMFLISTSQNYL